MIQIGEIISKLRKSRGLTQEKLAEVLGVSIAAVSKWETGSAYPDISLLPLIAKFFNVSVDYLFNYNLLNYDQVEEIIVNAESLFKERKFNECLVLLADGLIRFPNENKIKFTLGKFKTYYGVNLKQEQKKKVLGEAIAVLEEVIKTSNDRKIIDEAYNLISNCYMFLGQGEKALEVINNIITSNNVHPNAIRANILYSLGRIEEGNFQSNQNLYNSLTDIIANISNFTWNNRINPLVCLEYLNLLENILLAFSNNNDKSYLILDLSFCYEAKAWYYSKLDELDKSIYYLEKAVALILSYQENPGVVNQRFIFEKLNETDHIAYKDKNQKLQLKNVMLERQEYQKLKENNKFKELIELLN